MVATVEDAYQQQQHDAMKDVGGMGYDRSMLPPQGIGAEPRCITTIFFIILVDCG